MVPRIAKLARQGQPAELALEFIARYWKLSHDTARRIIREGRVAFPEVMELFHEFDPAPASVAAITRWLRSRAARVRRRSPGYVHDWDEERARFNELSAELELIFRRRSRELANRTFSDWIEGRLFSEKIIPPAKQH